MKWYGRRDECANTSVIVLMPIELARICIDDVGTQQLTGVFIRQVVTGDNV